MPKTKRDTIHVYKGGEYSHSRPVRKRKADIFAGGGSVAGKLRKRRDKVEGSAKAEEYRRGHYKRGGS